MSTESDHAHTARFVDAFTREPAGDVNVQIGSYVLRSDAQTGLMAGTISNGTYDVTVSKPGYYPIAYSNVTFGGDYTVAEPIQIIPNDRSVVDIRVVDDGQARSPISGATITLNGVDYLTDAEGRVRRILPNGLYNGSISIGGVVRVAGSFYLAQSMSIVVPIAR